MPYKKPILKELIAEFHLRPNTLGNDAFLPLLAALSGAGFTRHEFVSQPTSVSVGPSGLSTVSATRVRCWTPERTRCVQFSTDFIAVNYADVYPGKDAFLDLVRTAIGVLRDSPVGPGNAAETAIVAVDEFRRDQAFRIGDYFRCDGKLLPTQLADEHGCQLSLHWTHGAIDLTVQPVGQEHGAFLQSAVRRAVPGTEVSVGELLDASVGLFRELITSRTESEIMGGTL